MCVRAGEKTCSFYMRNGRCAFGATCKFHHPALPRGKVNGDGLNRMGTPMMSVGEYWTPMTQWYPQPIISGPIPVLPAMFGSACYGIPIQVRVQKIPVSP